MPHSKLLKGHVTYYTIALYFVEFILITKSKWERNIVRSKITVKTMLLIRFFYFYLEYMYTNSPFFNFSPGSIFLRCQLITWQKAYMSNLGILLVYLWLYCTIKIK